MEELDRIAEKVRKELEAKNAARDAALAASRELIRHCALSIRATHRAEYEEAAQLLARTREIAGQMKGRVSAYPDLYFTGYVQDALKEMAEAHIVYALITGEKLPDPDVLGVDYAAFLNGLGEAAGELRRYSLDIVRHGSSERCETVLAAMEDIYSLLVTMDFPDALKEMAEAHIVYALITNEKLPDPDALGVDYAAFLNGLGEAAGELRRYSLDIVRHGSSERCETVLAAMEDIYSLLVTMDFPDALTGGLRRTTDMVRGVLERTRGDLTIAARQEKLEKTLHEFESRFKG